MKLLLTRKSKAEHDPQLQKMCIQINPAQLWGPRDQHPALLCLRHRMAHKEDMSTGDKVCRLLWFFTVPLSSSFLPLVLECRQSPWEPAPSLCQHPRIQGRGLCSCVGTTARDRNRNAPFQYSAGFFSSPILVNEVLKMEILKIPGAVHISSLIRLTSYLT